MTFYFKKQAFSRTDGVFLGRQTVTFCLNMKFKHRDPNLVRVRNTIITEECLGKYDAFTFDAKTKKQVDVKLKVGESRTSFFPASLEDFESRDYFYVNTEKKDLKAENLVKNQRV